MSEQQCAVIRLDASESEAHQLADALAMRLQDEGVMARNTRRDDVWQPSEWMPGPKWRDVVEAASWLDHFETSANNGVDVIATRNVYHPVENLEPATCGGCRGSVENEYNALLTVWANSSEPLLACPMCGWEALIGDWPNRFGFAVGAPAVVFNNWPELTAGFLDSIRSSLGGRTRMVLTHM